MKIKRVLVLFMASVMIMGCCCVRVFAAAQSKDVLHMDDLKHGPVVWDDMGHWDGCRTRAYGNLDLVISKNNGMTIEESFKLNIGDTISYDCTYTPSNASVDFGFIAPDGLFYSVSGSNGSIDKTIRVSQKGSYTLAIRNNSDMAVTVTGTVDY